MEIWTSNLEISKICVKLKKKQQIISVVWVIFFTFLVPWLRFRRRIRVILWFCFVLEFWTTSSHFEICACVRRLSFPRGLSAPMFHWNWHFTQVFSQISLFNSAVYEHRLFDIPSYFAEFFGIFKAFWFTVRFRGKTVRPWDGITNSESWKVCISSNFLVWNKGVRCHLWSETTLFVLNSFKSAEVILKSNNISKWNQFQHDNTFILYLLISVDTSF